MSSSDYAEHLRLVTEAKDHLGLVAPELRGQLARYLDRGEEPSDLLCRIIDGNFSTGPEASEVAAWLSKHAPKECCGLTVRRLAWQSRVQALVSYQDEEHDTERPPAPSEPSWNPSTLSELCATLDWLVANGYEPLILIAARDNNIFHGGHYWPIEAGWTIRAARGLARYAVNLLRVKAEIEAMCSHEVAAQ